MRQRTPIPDGGRAVHIIQRNATIYHGDGFQWGRFGGGVGHWWMQSTCADFAGRSGTVTAECCDEPTEDCSTGAPTSCNVGCAAACLPFWNDCSALLNAQAPSLARTLEDEPPRPIRAPRFPRETRHRCATRPQVIPQP